MANPTSNLTPARGAWQFSLRSLLALTAACCLLLGWKADAALKQKQAAAAIIARSGRIAYGNDAQGRSPSVDVAAQWLGRDFVEDVTAVYWAGAAIEDRDLENLRHFPRLSTVSLASTPVTDEGLQRLAACPRLEFVDLRFTQVTAGGVERLRQSLPRAKVLRLNDAE